VTRSEARADAPPVATSGRYGGGVEVTFYGVRGSCPCAGARYRHVGGNTSCVLLTTDGDQPLVLDMGTGFRHLGEVLSRRTRATGAPLEATALLTHLHYDHILGLPFFAPLGDPGSVLNVFGPGQEGARLCDTLTMAVQPPFFPVEMSDFRGEVHFHDLGEEDFAIGAAKVRARAIRHLGPTLGFRVEADGRSLAYIPDHQAPLDRRSVPEGVLELCDGVDLLLHDGQYTDDEFVGKSHWGHSTPAFAVRVAAEAGARRLMMVHHDPAHTDKDIEEMVRSARKLPDARRLDEVSAAHEGGVVDLRRL
jgi:phosphoribosyl 1,2-cyclic phosphodiesterase